MPQQGYYRWPAISSDTIVFGAEDDLWSVPALGGVARRLTSGRAVTSTPHISPDGQWIAYSGREEGPQEVFVMPAEGGVSRRLTYLGCSTTAYGWSPDGSRVLFGTDYGNPIDRIPSVWSIALSGGQAERWPAGLALSIHVAHNGATAIGRNNNDPARWKRYRGGTAGEIWLDAEGTGAFRKLTGLDGNLARPMLVCGRLYFVSDHEGVANIYSTSLDFGDLQRHTQSVEYFVRFPNTDGTRIVYQCGADLRLLDPADGSDADVPVEFHGPASDRSRKFVPTGANLETADLSPDGCYVAVTSRARAYVMGAWEGPVGPLAAQDPPQTLVRRRLAQFLPGSSTVVSVVDGVSEPALELVDVPTLGEARVLRADIGRVTDLVPAPHGRTVALSNHRNQLLLVDTGTGELTEVERNPFGAIGGMDWSPDGAWLAYSSKISPYESLLKLWRAEDSTTHTITVPVLNDHSPSFDPGGKYLYFLGERDIVPVYDNLHFDLGFPAGTRPFVIVLAADEPSPLTPAPHALKPNAKKRSEADAEKEKDDREVGTKTVRIDLAGIENRVVGLPVPVAQYRQILGIKDKVLFTREPIEGAVPSPWLTVDPGPKGILEAFDLESRRTEVLARGVSGISTGVRDGQLLCRFGNRVRAITAGEKADEKTAGEAPGRRSGWLDLDRIHIEVDPVAEWRQMAREAWLLQREFFWTQDMSGIDWDRVWERYSPLLERVSTRSEFSDLMWEMQGELGTSHAYEYGGDHPSEPSYPHGFLGADISWSSDCNAYRIDRIVRGCPGDAIASSPLLAPGVSVSEGDAILAVDGVAVSATCPPNQLLVNQAGSEISLTVQRQDGAPQVVRVKTLKSEVRLRYRDWVEANRARVHEASGGRVGYVHIPDMGAHGYAEFHRLYLAEAWRDALVVDVRYNRGGHVSQLILEKLARRRVGYDVSRWGQPEPYPNHSIAGPMVMLTNQYAGSDGDIVSHCFKLMGLGPLIGVRTWGGVIGIWPRNPLADGTVTTQPEFSFWFTDVGWGVENYGTDPDIEVDVTPQDYVQGRDPQLERGIAEVTRLLDEAPPLKPDFADRPSLRLPGSLD